MSLNGFTAGQPWLRLPRPLNNALAQFPKEEGRPLVQGPADPPLEVDKAVAWGLARTGFVTLADEKRPAVVLTPFGNSIRSLVVQAVHDRRSQGPTFGFATIVDALPEHIRQWLLGTPPIAEEAPGPFFEALGVLAQVPGGYAPTPYGRAAIEAYRVGQRVGPGQVDLNVYPLSVISFLNSALQQGGLPVLDAHIDGREIKPLCEGYANIVRRANNVYYVNAEFVPLVRKLCTASVIDSYELFMLFPEQDRAWFLSGFALPPTCQRDLVFAKLGLVHIRSRKTGDVRLTKLGQKVLDEIKTRIAANEVAMGQGADLISADEFDLIGAPPPSEEPVPGDPFDILGGEPTEEELFDIL